MLHTNCFGGSPQTHGLYFDCGTEMRHPNNVAVHVPQYTD